MPKSYNHKTQIAFKQHDLKNGNKVWSAKIVPKRQNCGRLIAFSIEALRTLRGNQDWNATYDGRRLVAYITKYAAKPEKKSNIFNKLYKEFFINADENASTAELLRGLMLKVLGQRDISHHEALHQLMGLDLYGSNVTVVVTSLNSSKSLKKDDQDQPVLVNSMVDNYANRNENIEHMNFINYVKNHEKKNGKIVDRKQTEQISVRIFPNYSPSYKRKDYWMFCKYQLLRFRPWKEQHVCVLEAKYENTENGWINAWHDYLLDPETSNNVPKWEKLFDEAKLALEKMNKDDLELEDNLLNKLFDQQEDMADQLIVQPDWNKVDNDYIQPDIQITRSQVIYFVINTIFFIKITK